MVALVPNSPRRDSSSFRKIVDAFLSGEGLPFTDILSAERIERIFAKHGCQFGHHGIYTAAIMVWSFLSQVLRDGKECCLPGGRGASRQPLPTTGARSADRRYWRLLPSSSQALQGSGVA